MGRPAFGTKKLNYEHEVWELFEAYKNKIKSNPRVKIEYVGKDGTRVETPLTTPLTMEGFECFCFDNNITITHYFENKTGNYSDFCTICSRIKREIRQDQIEGGLCGQYNASITQRLNALKEHTSNDITQNIKILNVDPLDDSADNGVKENFITQKED